MKRRQFNLLASAMFLGLATRLRAQDPKPQITDWPDITSLKGDAATYWKTTRKAELKAEFEKTMYGKLPAPVPTGFTTILHEDKAAFGGKATVREVQFDLGAGVKPRMLVAWPNKANGKFPCFVGLNFTGNHTLLKDPKVAVPTGWMYAKYPGVKDDRATEAGRGTAIEVWDIERNIDAGFAVATCYAGDIEPDVKTIEGGVRQKLWKHKLPGNGDDTGSVMAWAWGIHRMIDHLEKMPAIDAKKLIVVGHSRMGKAALVATAFDDRVAVGIPHQSGCGGAAPSRGTVGESVQRINTSFPHWFCDNFKQFNTQPGRLPFDQHCLVALCAPRPVLFTNAVDDQWANPAGQFEVLQAATPVYKMLGVEGLVAGKMPEPGKLIDSRLGYGYRNGKHSMGPDDWVMFRAFAGKWVK